MSTTIPSFARVTTLSIHKVRRASTRLDIWANGLRDEGRWSNLVDSNMKLLKDRIEVMRTKERLEKICRPNGWDYDLNYLRKPKKQPEYLPTMALMFGTSSSLSILIDTTLLYIFSIIVHLNL